MNKKLHIIEKIYSSLIQASIFLRNWTEHVGDVLKTPEHELIITSIQH